MATPLFRYFASSPIQGALSEDKIARDIEILRVGKFVADSKGKSFEVTDAMLEEMAQNFYTLRDGGYLPNVPIRFVHISKSRDVRDIAGYVRDVRHEPGRLVVDGELTQPLAAEMFSNGTLRERSAEWGPFTTSDGKKFDNVLWGFAWADIPAVDRMTPMAATAEDDVEVVELNRPAEDILQAAVWSTAYINSLPDSAFAIINASGRHLPHHDKSGAVDMAHVSNAMSRLDQTEASVEEKAKARKHLEAHQPNKSATLEAPIPEEVFVMAKFTLDQIAHAELKTGEKVNDMSLFELPAAEVFTLEVEGTNLICADKATHDFVTAMVTERNEAKEAAAKAEAEQRKTYIESLKTAGKILGSPEALEDEVTLVASFNSDQYDAYVKRMDAQPSLVQLNKHDGDHNNDSPDEIAETEKALADLKAAGAAESQIAGMRAKLDTLKGETK